MTLAWVLFVLGIALSAFFSGSETGYYRATRARLTMDAAGGHRTAHGLMWLANNPVMFVATVLVGNNLANFLVSDAIVRGSQSVFQTEIFWVGLLAPILFSPIVFVYGELLPKDLFFQAPNRLLKASGGLFIICGILFLPFTAILWVLGRLLTFVIGEAPERLRASIARTELLRLFDEGQDAGVLKPAQRELAQSMFAIANQSIERFFIPAARLTTVNLGTATSEVIRLAQRSRASVVLVRERSDRGILGYFRMIDLYTESPPKLEAYQELTSFSRNDSAVHVLIEMQTKKLSLAKVIDDQGKDLGIVSLNELVKVVWRGSH